MLRLNGESRLYLFSMFNILEEKTPTWNNKKTIVIVNVKTPEVPMILHKIAYVTNWIFIIIGILLLLPVFSPPNGDFIQHNDIFSMYQEAFGFLGVFVFVLLFGLFASCLAFLLQIRHLIILSLLLFFSPFLWIGFMLLS